MESFDQICYLCWIKYREIRRHTRLDDLHVREHHPRVLTQQFFDSLNSKLSELHQLLYQTDSAPELSPTEDGMAEIRSLADLQERLSWLQELSSAVQPLPVERLDEFLQTVAAMPGAVRETLDGQELDRLIGIASKVVASVVMKQWQDDSESVANAHFEQGDRLFAEERYTEAIREYSRGLELNPDHWGALHVRGLAYEKLGQCERAIEDITAALEINLDYAAAFHSRGLIRARLEQYELAVEDFTRALQCDPEYAEAYYNRGLAYDRLEQTERAIEDYTGALLRMREDAHLVDAYFNRGSAYYDSGDYERAVEDFSSAIRINPEDAEAYHSRGLAYQKLGRTELAEADLRRAEELKGPRI